MDRCVWGEEGEWHDFLAVNWRVKPFWDCFEMVAGGFLMAVAVHRVVSSPGRALQTARADTSSALSGVFHGFWFLLRHPYAVLAITIRSYTALPEASVSLSPRRTARAANSCSAHGISSPSGANHQRGCPSRSPANARPP